MTARAAHTDLARLRERLRLLEARRVGTLAELDATRAARVSALIAGDPAPDPPAGDLEGAVNELGRAVDLLHDQLAAAEQEAAATHQRELKELAAAKVAEADTAAREFRTWLRGGDVQDRLTAVRSAIAEAREAEQRAGPEHTPRAGGVLFNFGLARVVGELELYLADDPVLAEERRRASVRNWPSPTPRDSEYIIIPGSAPGSA